MNSDEMEGSGLSRVGPDAWDTTPSVEDLAAALARRTAPVKALLLDQVTVSGLGNIRRRGSAHGGHPSPSPGGSLSEDELKRLLEATRAVLGDAIDTGEQVSRT